MQNRKLVKNLKNLKTIEGATNIKTINPFLINQREEVKKAANAKKKQITATKIQAGFRGMQNRKLVKNLKNLKTIEATTNIKQLEGFLSNKREKVRNAATKRQQKLIEEIKTGKKIAAVPEPVSFPLAPAASGTDKVTKDAINKLAKEGAVYPQFRQKIQQARQQELEQLKTTITNAIASKLAENLSTIEGATNIKTINPFLINQREEVKKAANAKKKQIAATKFQAGFRGKKNRNLVKQKLIQEIENGKKNSELGILSKKYKKNDNVITAIAARRIAKQAINAAIKNSATSEAATRTQATFRGMRNRKLVKNLKNIEATTNIKKLDKFLQNKRTKVKNAATKRQQALAATKLQAGFRGMRNRKLVKNLKNLKTIEATTNIKQLEGFLSNKREKVRNAATKRQQKLIEEIKTGKKIAAVPEPVSFPLVRATNQTSTGPGIVSKPKPTQQELSALNETREALGIEKDTTTQDTQPSGPSNPFKKVAKVAAKTTTMLEQVKKIKSLINEIKNSIENLKKNPTFKKFTYPISLKIFINVVSTRNKQTILSKIKKMRLIYSNANETVKQSILEQIGPILNEVFIEKIKILTIPKLSTLLENEVFSVKTPTGKGRPKNLTSAGPGFEKPRVSTGPSTGPSRSQQPRVSTGPSTGPSRQPVRPSRSQQPRVSTGPSRQPVRPSRSQQPSRGRRP